MGQRRTVLKWMARSCFSGADYFHVAKAQCETEVQPNRMLDNLRWKPVSLVGNLCHAITLAPLAKPIQRVSLSMPIEDISSSCNATNACVYHRAFVTGQVPGTAAMNDRAIVPEYKVALLPLMAVNEPCLGGECHETVDQLAAIPDFQFQDPRHV